MKKKSKLTWFERITAPVAPSWTLNRIRSRLVTEAVQRNYEAAAVGSHRTNGWIRNAGDANAIVGPALKELRQQARNLVRNNSWAKRAQRVISNNTVGWGLTAKPVNATEDLIKRWQRWSNTTACDVDGRHNFAGLQRLVMQAVASDGEVLIRRRWRMPKDNLPLPFQLEVIEADWLDTSKDDDTSKAGGPIVQGIEFDKIGRRAAYWLFDAHPGSGYSSGISTRVKASEILHVFYVERPGQFRGASWFGSAIVNLNDLDEFDDAELMKQKIAACFSAFVKDTDGFGSQIGAEESEGDDTFDQLAPGFVSYLKPGKDVTFATPPAVTEGSFSTRNLRRVAAGIGVTYEDMTGDYSQVNFSSARMARLSHWENVHDWRFNMLIPILCDGVWNWAVQAGEYVGASNVDDPAFAEWAGPPMPMIEPDKEGLAYQRLIRNGTITPSAMIREQGGDPATHWKELADDLNNIRALGIKLDGDVSAVSQAGLTQERAGASGGRPVDAPEDAARSDDLRDDLPDNIFEIAAETFQ